MYLFLETHTMGFGNCSDGWLQYRRRRTAVQRTTYCLTATAPIERRSVWIEISFPSRLQLYAFVDGDENLHKLQLVFEKEGNSFDCATKGRRQHLSSKTSIS